MAHPAPVDEFPKYIGARLKQKKNKKMDDRRIYKMHPPIRKQPFNFHLQLIEN